MDMEILFPGGKRVDAKYDEFIVKTDQSVTNGGSGSAPSPLDLFLASIATCTGYYVLSFCLRNNIPTENIQLTAHFRRNTETHLVENVRIDIHVSKNFPEKYKNAVVKAADVCSVKKHLQNPPTIEIKLVSR